MAPRFLLRRLASLLLPVVVGLLALEATRAESEPPPGGPRNVLELIAELKRYDEEQNWSAKLETARQGVARFQEPEYRSDVVTLALKALGDYADKRGPTEALDAEARRYYQEAIATAEDAGDRARAEHVMGLYYSQTSRPGAVLPHALRELAHYEKADDPVMYFLSLAGMATTYGDMGQTALESHFRTRALELASKHFILGLRPPPGKAWLAYTDVLKQRMDEVAAPGNAEEILALWKVAKPIHYAYGSPYVGYMRAANYLAVAGDRERAEALFQKGLAEAERSMAERPAVADAIRRDLVCDRAALETHAGRFAKAVELHDECAEQTRALFGSEEPSGDVNLPRFRAIAHEGIGDLDRAIELYRRAVARSEVSRASFEVAQRATFFRTVVRKSYWGLIRCLAKRAALTHDESDFLHALQASELVRGRQLGELLDPEADPTLAIEALASLRTKLAPEEVVLDYLLTDREIVVFAVTREDWAVAVIPYDTRAFADEVRRVAKDLASPGSRSDDIGRRLDGIADEILRPASRLLHGKKAIVYLPDGALNLVPFDLLRDPESGGPLIRSRTVRVAPSLRFLLGRQSRPQEPSTGSLFALADPSYRASYEVAGLEASALRRAVRGSDYLGYFAPLPETRTEVEAISRLFDRATVKIVLGHEASESTVKSADLRPFRFVHLATHGILGGEVPGVVEPALVLAEERREDGFLLASEASDLRLNADLTVLSACKTGSGEYVTGEGVMGMSRAFLVAGSRSVLVSLWSVDSRATEQLMTTFYRHLEAGLEAPAALRQAKLDLMTEFERGEGWLRGLQRAADGGEDAHGLHPFYWAAFILVGG